eukprot:TRINITY_DN97520_c0_g1_i1.p1 TRINITY_DN97520_c0_g1~~TRINITY_DN97520_c0_g1_i1.p1  ORF type:complete len:112 (-),score=8.27 TRINITY_DN97520_c0_g1_i1:80-382(-)
MRCASVGLIMVWALGRQVQSTRPDMREQSFPLFNCKECSDEFCYCPRENRTTLGCQVDIECAHVVQEVHCDDCVYQQRRCVCPGGRSKGGDCKGLVLCVR